VSYAQLQHDPTPVQLHSFFRNSQEPRDVLVQPAGNDQLEHLALARCQRFHAGIQGFEVGALRSNVFFVGKRFVDRRN
jgi:hypothetical protein